MKKLILAVVALSFIAVIMPGCKAKAEVDKNSASNVGVAR